MNYPLSCIRRVSFPILSIEQLQHSITTKNLSNFTIKPNRHMIPLHNCLLQSFSIRKMWKWKEETSLAIVSTTQPYKSCGKYKYTFHLRVCTLPNGHITINTHCKNVITFAVTIFVPEKISKTHIFRCFYLFSIFSFSMRAIWGFLWYSRNMKFSDGLQMKLERMRGSDSWCWSGWGWIYYSWPHETNLSGIWWRDYDV